MIAATFPQLRMEMETLAVWRELLSDIPDERFMEATARLCREVEVYPGTNIVKEIRERANSRTAGIVALAKFEEAMRDVGAYKTVVFDDPLIHLVVGRMGGWPKLCAMPESEWKFARRDFEKMYDHAAGEPIPLMEIPPALPGIHEIANSAAGNRDAVVQLATIGDRERAALWTTERRGLVGKVPFALEEVNR